MIVKGRAAVVVVVVALSALALPTTTVPPAGAASNRVISMDDDFYDPVVLRIRPGDSVQWRNDGARRHTATTQAGAPRSFDVPDPNNCSAVIATCQQPGQTAPLQPLVLEEEGTYNYYCKLHGRRAVRPDPERGATSQPCLMCAIIVVGDPEPAGGGSGGAKDDEPGGGGGSGSDAGDEKGAGTRSSPTPSTAASPAAAPAATASASPTPAGTSGPEVAAGEEKGGGGDGIAATVGALLLLGVFRLFWRVLRPRVRPE